MKLLYFNSLFFNAKKYSLSFILLSLVFFINHNSFAQVIPIAGETECFVAGNGGVFTDPGGLAANYPNCACETVTTLCSTDGSAITLNFTFFDVFATFDYVEIYDGMMPSGTALFNNGTGGANAGDITLAAMMTSAGTTSFTGTTGCITMLSYFTGVVDYEGWAADITTASGATHPGDNLTCGTNLSCLAPPNIDITNITANSADATWMASDSAMSYNIEFGLGGFTLGTGTMSNTTNLSMPLTGLTQNTTYDFYIQSDCGNGELSNFAGPFSFTTTFANPCDYTIQLYDSFGDGWNGSILNVSVGGIGTDYTILPTQNGGDSAIYTINAGSNIPLIFTYTAGSFQNEVSYNILDPNGNIIFSDGPNPATGVVFETFACPTCPGALNLTVDQVFGLSADVSWIDSDSAGVYIVEYGPTGFLPGTGTTFSTTAANAMIPGLDENTEYDFYVIKNCDNGDTSALTGPETFMTIALNDVGIVGINSPLSGCGLGEETISVIMENFGSNPQSLIPFFYSVNGVPVPINVPLDGYYTNVIGKDSMEVLEFEAKYDFSAPGTYEIAAWTEMDPDSDMNNDTFYYTITSIPTIPDFPYAQNFETDNGGWAVSDDSQNPSWDFGAPAGTDISNAASGVNSWVTNLTGNYNNNELSYVVSNCFDFSGLTDDPVISLSVNYDSETNWDGGWLESTIDGGQTWTKVGAVGTGINWYTVTNINTGLGDVWAGNSGGWILAKHTLDGMAGEPNVRFRFGFGSDGSVNGFDGIGIDDVAIFIPVANDLAAQSVTNATLLECGDPNDQVTITIVNNGTANQTGFDVGYQVDGGLPVVENVGALINLAPDESAQYTFTTPFNSAVGGTINITAWTDLAGELNVVNDTTTYAFQIFQETPLREDFEAGTVIPQGWTSDGIVGNGHNNISNVIYRNMYSSIPSFEVVSPPIGPIEVGDTMTFDYRYTDWSAGDEATILGDGDSLVVEVSTDCGMTYNTLLTIDQNNHITSADLATVEVDISSLAGQNVVFRWSASWGTGDYWMDIDNINIWQCGSFDLVADITDESVEGFSDGAATIIPTGSAGPYTYAWSNGNLTQSATGLEPGTYTVAVLDGFGCTDQVEFTIAPGAVNTNEIEALKKIVLAPNPTDGIAILDMAFSENVDLKIEVINVMGQVLFQTFKDNTIEERIDINMTDFASGMYFVRVSVDNQTIVKKLMKGSN